MEARSSDASGYRSLATAPGAASRRRTRCACGRAVGAQAVVDAARRSARTVRGKYTGPGRCRGCASRRRARTGSARRRAGSARRRSRRSARAVGSSGAYEPHLDRARRACSRGASALSSRLTSTRRRCSGSNTHAERLVRQLDLQRRSARRASRRAARAQSLHSAGDLPLASIAPASLTGAGRHLHHVVDDALQPLDVVGHHRVSWRWPASSRPRPATHWPARSPPAGCGSRARCRPTRVPSRPAFPAACAPACCARPRAAARRTPRSPV